MSDPLAAAFRALLGASPAALVTAPGRVNLIGEHTDYSLLPVLPIAIDRATRIAAAPTGDGHVRALSRQFEGEARLARSALEREAALPWQRYLAGVLRQLEGEAPGRGALLLVDGDLPTTGGLSSSSAFTMALFAALDRVWALGLGLERLVELAIVAERHVGVESGGMDQTVIAHGRAGCALRIEFAPVRRRAVPLPSELSVVVADSGETAPKGGSARQAYNERVVGCRLAAALLGRRLGVELPSPPLLGPLAHTPGIDEALAGLPERVSAREVAAETGLACEDLVRLTAARFEADAPLAVRRMARHVFSEARRVDEAEAALASSDLEGFGALLAASHRSLDEDYGCSTAGLDRLCQAMTRAGALGARLTGAGFGGYALGATRPETLARVLEAARAATGRTAFAVRASDGLRVEDCAG